MGTVVGSDYYFAMKRQPDLTNLASRTVVVVAIMVAIALIHIFRLGTYLDGELFTLYYSYFSDIVIPFGMYFLLCLNDLTIPHLADWRLKALLVFVASSATEILQAFGLYALGTTYDPLDILMFAVGVLLAAFVDRIVFLRLFRFWAI